MLTKIRLCRVKGGLKLFASKSDVQKFFDPNMFHYQDNFQSLMPRNGFHAKIPHILSRIVQCRYYPVFSRSSVAISENIKTSFLMAT